MQGTSVLAANPDMVDPAMDGETNHIKASFLPLNRIVNGLAGTPSLDPASLAKQYSSLCATPTVSCSGPQLSNQQVIDLYGKGLTAAAELQKKSVKPETLRIRQRAFSELAGWMHSKHAACNRSAKEAIPEDIMYIPHSIGCPCMLAPSQQMAS